MDLVTGIGCNDELANRWSLHVVGKHMPRVPELDYAYGTREITENPKALVTPQIECQSVSELFRVIQCTLSGERWEDAFIVFHSKT
jgi:hypothetical protein